MADPGVHLCGSVPLTDAETVFRSAAARLGDRLKRLPDGETGERSNWIRWQLPKLQTNPDLESVAPPNRGYSPLLKLRPREGVDPEAVAFGDLGYADQALASWQLFSRLKAERVIPSDVRFQVSLPTPVAVITQFVAEQQADLERPYEARLLEELGEIASRIPHGELAVQWDTAVEFGILEGAFPSWLGDDRESRERAIGERLVRLGNAVPDGVELGYHLCYGDFQHRHFVEPADTGQLTAVANRIAAGLERRLDWIHLPVPRDRTDEAYFAPLADLRLPPETEFYLGLLHATDGIEGARRRVAAARSVVSDFGVATECGLGRREPEQIPGLLDLHATVADSLA